MKTLINHGRPVVMTTNREPLDLQLSISQRSGDPLTQTQDVTAGTWTPDRQVAPLVLDPQVTVYDPESKQFVTISTGYINWYVGEIKDWDSTTETGLVGVSDSSANYSLEYSGGSKTGSLIVRKNIHYQDPVALICVVSFTDAARAEAYRTEQSVLLTSENRPDEYDSVVIEAESLVRYRPFEEDAPSRTLTAVASRGSTVMEFPYTNGIKYFWYFQRAGAWTLIPTDGTYAPYVSGQGTASLVVDCDYIEHETIMVRIASHGTYTAVSNPSGNPKTKGYFEQVATGVYSPTNDTAVATGKTYYSLSQTANAPDCDTRAVVDIVREVPSIESLPYCTGGSAVRQGDTPRTFRSVIYADNKDMDDALRAEYIRLNWKSKPTNSNTVTDRGWGDECVIPSGSLITSGLVNVEVYNEIGVLSALELITDENGVLLTDDSGSATASDNSGYVVGRV